MRMLGSALRSFCPKCRVRCGPDCPDTAAKSKGAARAAEKRQWKRTEQ